ncbi:hypothetical protein EJB05_11112, partial [Eragrostis curvula]
MTIQTLHCRVVFSGHRKPCRKVQWAQWISEISTMKAAAFRLKKRKEAFGFSSDAGDSAARLSGAMHERTRTRRFGQWRRLLRCPTCHQPLRTSRLWPWLFAFAKGL